MRSVRQVSGSATVRDFAVETARLLADRKCEDIRLLDVRGISQVCDFMVIASGTSERQMKSVAEEVKATARDRELAVFRRSADISHTWVVLDLIDIVVHLFEPNLRLYYDLEGLWSDAEAIDWRREDQQGHHRFRGEIGLSFDDSNGDGAE